MERTLALALAAYRGLADFGNCNCDAVLLTIDSLTRARRPASASADRGTANVNFIFPNPTQDSNRKPVLGPRSSDSLLRADRRLDAVVIERLPVLLRLALARRCDSAQQVQVWAHM